MQFDNHLTRMHLVLDKYPNQKNVDATLQDNKERLKEIRKLADETLKIGQNTLVAIDEQDQKMDLASKELSQVRNRMTVADKSLKNMEDECKCTLF